MILINYINLMSNNSKSLSLFEFIDLNIQITDILKESQFIFSYLWRVSLEIKYQI